MPSEPLAAWRGTTAPNLLKNELKNEGQIPGREIPLELAIWLLLKAREELAAGEFRKCTLLTSVRRDDRKHGGSLVIALPMPAALFATAEQSPAPFEWGWCWGCILLTVATDGGGRWRHQYIGGVRSLVGQG